MLARFVFMGLLISCHVTVQAQDSRSADSLYTVKPGDTLFSISRGAGVPIDSIRAWNGLENVDLRAGLTLRLVPRPRTPVVSPDSIAADDVRLGAVFEAWGLSDCDCAWADTVRVTRIPPDRLPTSYTVRRGDTLFGVARAHGVSTDDIKSANAMTSSDIRIGQVLSIPGSDGSIAQEGHGVLPPVSGEVSGVVYPIAREGRMLGDGSRLTAERHVIGHPTLPLGSLVILELAETGKQVPVLVADRSPSPGGVRVDLSPAVADRLGLAQASDKRLLIRIVPYERTDH